MLYLCTTETKNPFIDMSNNDTKMSATERIFREKAESYLVCQSTTCPLRDHCLRSILSGYVDEGRVAVTSINLGNPDMQRADCPQFRDSQPIRVPVGLENLYRDMPGRLERAIREHLIGLFTRKRYYQYRNGVLPISPDVEQTIRQTLLRYGWQEEPHFDDYAEEYLW